MQAPVQGPLAEHTSVSQAQEPLPPSLPLMPLPGIKDSSLLPPLGVILPLVPEVIGMGKDH